MALFRGLIATAISGSLDGITFSHNKGGTYIRTRATPVNPNTPYQQLTRALLGAVAIGWSGTLTQAQRDAWDVYAANVPRPSRGGGTKFLSGLDMFIRCAVPRGVAELGLALDAPTIFDIGTYTDASASISAPSSTIDIAFDNTDEWANEDNSGMLIFAGRPTSPGRKFFKGPFRFLGSVPGNSTTPPSSPLAMSMPWSADTGNKLWFRQNVSRADNRYGEPLIFPAVVS
jgi:hypothetical protein